MQSPDNYIKEILKRDLPAFRAKQILHAVYTEGKGDYEEMTNLPATLRPELTKELPIFSLEKVIEVGAKDKSVTKALFTTHDGKKLETVLMNFKDGRHTVCVSSQVGCQMGCKFCATGKMGFARNLTDEEISDQVLYFKCRLAREGKRISNIVFMGMGEPFMNYDNVMSAIKNFINSPDGMAIAARNITVSTCGIPEGIESLANDGIQVNLAVSLHAPSQGIREKIMPIAKKYDIEELIQSIDSYLSKTNRRVSYEYVMLKDINDSAVCAADLASLIQHQLCHVNLIPYNATDMPGMEEGEPPMVGSEKNRINKFAKILKESGIETTVRVSLGREIDAACGQLANKAG